VLVLWEEDYQLPILLHIGLFCYFQLPLPPHVLHLSSSPESTLTSFFFSPYEYFKLFTITQKIIDVRDKLNPTSFLKPKFSVYIVSLDSPRDRPCMNIS